MANYKRKSGYKHSRSCGLCKPWKRLGNSKHRLKKPIVQIGVYDED